MKRLILFSLVLTFLVSVPLPGFALDDKDASVIASWHFDEGSGGKTKDAGGKGYDGAIHGAVWKEGKKGSSLFFNGEDNYVEFLSRGMFKDLESFTIRFWFNPGIDFDTTLGFKEDGKPKQLSFFGPWAVHISYDSRGWVSLRLMDSSNAYHNMNVDRTYKSGTWYYLAYVYDGSSVYLYEDGRLLNSSFAEGKVGDLRKNVWIGAEQGYGSYFNGTIDEVIVLKKALNPKEIQEDYRTVTNGK